MLIQRNTVKSQRGQALLEVLISFAVITIVLVAVVSRATEAARNAAFSRNKVLAARFAQEGVEWSRAQRDQMGWEAFESEITPGGSVVFCVLDISNALTSFTPGACAAGSFIGTTIFDRNVQIDHTIDGVNGENYVDVQVTVSWSDSIGVHDAQYSTRLSDWQI